MTGLKAISCDAHDYIEIACLFHYRVQLTLLDDTAIQVTLHNTTFDSARQECVEAIDQENNNIFIPLNHIRKMDVLTANAKFSCVTIAVSRACPPEK